MKMAPRPDRKGKANSRLWEIDMLRGLALVLMVVYHFLYDLNVFFNIDIVYYQGPVYYLGKAAAVLFILIAGTSCTFSRHNASRGIKIIAWGFVIFLVTGLVLPGSNIVFGILQFLGVCILFYPVYRGISPYLLAGAGILIILAADMTSHFIAAHNWLVPLGLKGPDFSSVDYFPLVPWAGVFLLGVSSGKLVYIQKRSRLVRTRQFLNPLASAGKYTLLIYLIHQPLILAVLYLVFKMRTILAL